MTRSIDSLIDAIKRSPLTGDGIDPSAAHMLVAEVERLRAERDEARAALLEVRSYLSKVPCSGPCDGYGICSRCSAEGETYLSEDAALDQEEGK